MRAAAVQLTTTRDKAANLEAALAACAEAARDGAELVILPEATMCAFGPPDADLVAAAEPLEGPFVSALAGAVARTGSTVVAGMFEPADRPGRVYNTVVAVGPDGVLGSYRKLHLYDAFDWCESAGVAPGDPATDPLLVFSLGGVTFGVLTCYDLRFPEMARVLVDRGATALVVPAHWPTGPGKADAWTILLRARAIESTAYVLAAAKPAPECTGLSMIVDPAGVVLASLAADDEGIVAAELSPERVAAVRAEVPVLAHRRFSVTRRA